MKPTTVIIKNSWGRELYSITSFDRDKIRKAIYRESIELSKKHSIKIIIK